MSGGFAEIRRGALVSIQGRTFRVTHVLGMDSVLAEDVATKAPKQFGFEAITPWAGDGPPQPATLPDAEAVEPEEWKVAQDRMAVIRPLLGLPGRTRAQVAEAAAGAGVDAATVYAWIKLYEHSEHLFALIPRKAGHAAGTRLLDRKVDAIIERNIRKRHMSKQRGGPAEVIRQVDVDCDAAGLPRPHPNTVRNRIRDKPAVDVLKAQGRADEAHDRFAPTMGSFPPADRPLAVVQIDHTLADVEVVDEELGRTMGRPWLTVAIDVRTRVVVGIYVSMDHPNAFSAGATLVMAMLPKGEVLRRHGLTGDWPIFGKIGKVHSDNAREFRGEDLRKACEQHRIDTEFRPRGKPRYGGHIERFMGTGTNLFHNLPGTTKSSTKDKGGYDSGKEAVLTLAELEAVYIDFVVNEYHLRPHSALGTSPLSKLKRDVEGDGLSRGAGVPQLPRDPARLRRDFLPYHERTVQPDGVVIEGVHYWKEVLTARINETDPDNPKATRKFLFRQDPRLISPIWYYDPDTREYYEIHYKDPTRPATNIWEVRAARKQLRLEGKKEAEINEPAIFACILRRRQVVDAATARTASARRAAHRAERSDRMAAAPRNEGVGGRASRAPQAAQAGPSEEAAEGDGTDVYDDIVPAPVRGEG